MDSHVLLRSIVVAAQGMFALPPARSRSRQGLAYAQKDRHHAYMQTVFEAAGGTDGLRRLADAWHRRVMAGRESSPMRSAMASPHPQHVERLAAYWAEALGGPTAYSDSYGDETAVVKIHSRQRGTR